MIEREQVVRPEASSSPGDEEESSESEVSKESDTRDDIALMEKILEEGRKSEPR